MTNNAIIGVAHVVALAGILTAGLILVAQNDLYSNPQNSNQSGTNTSSKTKNTNSSSETSTTGGLSSSDRKFLMEAAMGGMVEVELGHRAIQTGQSDTVKQFGQRMVDDHSAANAELMT